MNVGQTILSQMRALNMQDLMCWGAEKFMTFESGQLIKEESHCGGLLFKVSGMIFKGHVVVSLTGSDLYEVRIGKYVKSKGVFTQVGEIKKEVYVEDLNQTIDSLVEGYYEKGKATYQKANIFENI